MKKYDVETIYEFLSLGLAAFPYRFLFFSVDLPIVAIVIVCIKFTYKTIGYFVVYLPCSIRLKKRFSKKEKAEEKIGDKPSGDEIKPADKSGVENDPRTRNLTKMSKDNKSDANPQESVGVQDLDSINHDSGQNDFEERKDDSLSELQKKDEFSSNLIRLHNVSI